MNLVNLLLQNGVIPVLVFDGQDVPIKQKENESRRKYIEFILNIKIEKENKINKRRAN